MNHLHQYSTISSIMQGISSGGPPVADILTTTNHGLGTVPHFNGEIIIVDGQAYHFTSDSEVHLLKSSDKMPFFMATDFQPTFTTTLPELTMASLPQALPTFFPGKQNCFVSVRVDGVFKKVVYRVAPAQSKPKEPLVQLIKRQELRSYVDVKGTLFGFYSPPYTNGFSVAGFHLHFLSDDRKAGGHVMDFESKTVELKAACATKYHVELSESPEYNEDLTYLAGQKDINAVEGFKNEH